MLGSAQAESFERQTSTKHQENSSRSYRNRTRQWARRRRAFRSLESMVLSSVTRVDTSRRYAQGREQAGQRQPFAISAFDPVRHIQTPNFLIFYPSNYSNVKMPAIPSEDELTMAIVQLKKDNPELGIAKVHARLTGKYPDWTVSEQRTRKIIQNQGLIISTPRNMHEVNIYPSSRLVAGLHVPKWTSKVGVRWFGKKKGKGLVATQEIIKGEVIWKEDPFIIAPEWWVLVTVSMMMWGSWMLHGGFRDIFDLQKQSLACAFCTTPLGDSPLALACSASNATSPCAARFCNRLCLVRSAQVHPLLCSARNPACVPLLNFVRETEWMTLHALAQCMSRLLLADQMNEKAFTEDWEFVKSLAELGMEERFKYSFRL